MSPELEGLVRAAEAVGGTVVRSAGALVIVIATSAGADPAEMVPIAEGARLAGTTVRALRDAARRGELTLYGRERSRVARRADVLAWIEGRRVAPVAGPLDADIDRRMARLARGRTRSAG